jgi:restriction endonuclease-like protein
LLEDLSRRALAYGDSIGALSYRSNGSPGVTLFPVAADGSRHGNFLPASFAAIRAEETWADRLAKPHSRRRTALPTPHDADAGELDSCTSSDALLMNVFCLPGVMTGEMAALLSVAPGSKPSFGIPGLVQLEDGRTDATEIDMRIGDAQVEAKLTEADFTRRPVAHVERYAGLYETFDREALPRDGDEYLSYQLIRNVLAVAPHPNRIFRVLLDARRPDLLHEWWRLFSAIRDADVRLRCGFVLWQEIASVAPTPLQEFLATKYGL